MAGPISRRNAIKLAALGAPLIAMGFCYDGKGQDVMWTVGDLHDDDKIYKRGRGESKLKKYLHDKLVYDFEGIGPWSKLFEFRANVIDYSMEHSGVKFDDSTWDSEVAGIRNFKLNCEVPSKYDTEYEIYIDVPIDYDSKKISGRVKIAHGGYYLHINMPERISEQKIDKNQPYVEEWVSTEHGQTYIERTMFLSPPGEKREKPLREFMEIDFHGRYRLKEVIITMPEININSEKFQKKISTYDNITKKFVEMILPKIEL